MKSVTSINLPRMSDVQLDETQMREVVESVWLSTVGLSISPTVNESPPAAEFDRFLFGQAQISGAYTGVVTITCPRPLARQAMSIMCDVDQDSLTESEIRDALGEVTNMISGNVKSLLPGPSSLSLPIVGDNFNDGLSVEGSKLVKRVAFDCLGDLLVVTLAEM